MGLSRGNKSGVLLIPEELWRWPGQAQGGEAGDIPEQVS